MGLCLMSWLLSHFLVHCVMTSNTNANVVYITPSEVTTCNSSQLCLTLNDYASDQGIVDDTTFMFLRGAHRLDVPLSLTNISNIQFVGAEESDATRVLLGPLVKITWRDCDNVKITGLTFTFNGQTEQEFSRIVFERTNATLSNVTVLGHYFMTSALFFNDSSYVNMSSVRVFEVVSSRGPALYATNSTVDFYGQCDFVNNTATYEGGAVALHNCTANFVGSILFLNNTASCGGALFTFGGSQHFLGNVSFIDNTARHKAQVTRSYDSYDNTISECTRSEDSYGLGGGMMTSSCEQTISGNMTFMNNTALIGGAVWNSNCNVNVVSANISFADNKANSGGAMSVTDGIHNVSGHISFVNNVAMAGSGGGVLISGGRHDINGNMTFVNNRAFLDDLDFRGGGAVSITNSTYCITGYASFDYNSAPYGNGGAMSVANINITLSGDITFTGNTAMYDGGALVLYAGNGDFSGNISFWNNSVSSRNGGALSINNGQLNISGNSSFVQNTAWYEAGALEYYRSSGFISGHCSFINNSILYTFGSGGAVEMDTIKGERLVLSGTQRFEGNSAERGGALAFFGRYKLTLTSPLQLSFIKNLAMDDGGAMYFADDTSARVQCAIPYFSRDDCHLELSSLSDIQINFSHNVAGQAGTLIYGGGLDTCRLYTGGGIVDIFGQIEGGTYSNDPTGTIRNLSNIVSADNITSDISSNRLKVCVCEGERRECEFLQRAVVRGQEFTLLASILEQSNTVVGFGSNVRISLEDDTQIDTAQRLQKVKEECTPISYRLFSNRNQTSITLSPDNSACQDGLRVNVTFLPCPDAFVLQGSECICERRLRQNNTTCNVDDGSISRSTNSFWMKPLYENETYKGLVLHSGCPFDYCIDTTANITFTDLDAQCDHNHSGMLCGSCKENFSIALGTLHCLPCTNNYLALIILFALAGIALVAVLLLLQASVAKGTINGLIFFTNIVQANRSDFFPPNDTNILTVFIAWMNLDLGIEVCLYDGMTTYVYAWLQFLFPFYVWFLIGIIILACNYSSKIAGHIGSNPVAILATIFLLSYSKLLNNIIVVLSLTRLDYPESSKYVWLYDGNVTYFHSFSHCMLAIFAILVFIILFLPYTLLLFFSPWLQTFSNRRILSWLNKTKPILDAYYGPYKKSTRYWTALLLLVRGILFLAFALSTLSTSKLDLLLVTSLTAGLAGLAWIHNGVYEKLHNDMIEASFIINLCILAAATYHVQESGGSQAALVYTSVGLAFVTFICIILFHILLPLHKTSIWKKISKEYKVSANQAAAEQDVDLEKLNPPVSVTTTEVELREPLLD